MTNWNLMPKDSWTVISKEKHLESMLIIIYRSGSTNEKLYLYWSTFCFVDS